jgi:hypothetical protein
LAAEKISTPPHEFHIDGFPKSENNGAFLLADVGFAVKNPPAMPCARWPVPPAPKAKRRTVAAGQ